jgi:formate hydrogenlyase transcriptional activator
MSPDIFDKKPRIGKASREMRKRAEQLLGEKAMKVQNIAPDDIPALIHELQVHQLELALQNEELLASQLQLEESWARYVYLYDHAPVGYFTFDGKGRILAVNLTGSRQLGLERDTMLKRLFSSFMSRDDGDLFSLHLKKVFATGSKQSCILTLFQEKAKPFHAQLDSIPSVQGTDENPLCQTTVTDITERKELEEALQVSETFFRRLFAEAREGILIVDAETGQISDVNPFLTEMLGYSHEDFLGKKLWEIGLFKDVEAWRASFAELQSKGCVRYDNLPLATKNGRLIAVEFISSVFLVNHHKVIQCHIRDVTRRQLGSDSLQKAHNGTEQRVRELRADQRMSNERLEQERKRHRQTEESLLKALTEIKTLKDRLVIENIYFHQESNKKHQFNNIIGQSDGLRYVLYRAEQVAPTDTTVLILGETGTGKELIAAAIHNLSPRKDRPMITVNCAALPANLIESELFGREKGAFTGADTRQIGRFEFANGSTICLDEIGELPLELQAKLLRVIQHGEFERLGSSKSIKVDVRILATTNRNLEEAIRTGRFREDLYYRLNVFPITVPPLRQRAEDIPLLVQAFVERYARKLGKQITSIPKETMKALQDYPWPGNIRELESIIERAVILCPGPVLQLADKLHISPFPLSSPVATMQEMERNQILQALAKTRWRIEGKNGAAQLLGLHPSTLRARMHKLGIVRPNTRSSV